MNFLTLIGKSWKTHPKNFRKFQFSVHELDRFVGNSTVFGWLFQRLVSFTSQNSLITKSYFLDEFSRNGFLSCLKILKSATGWVFQILDNGTLGCKKMFRFFVIVWKFRMSSEISSRISSRASRTYTDSDWTWMNMNKNEFWWTARHNPT